MTQNNHIWGEFDNLLLFLGQATLNTIFGAGFRRKALIFQFSRVNQLSDFLDPPVALMIFDCSDNVYIFIFSGSLVGGPHLSALSSPAAVA
jgi:hypothetical protein